jgi:hypothetical protein
MMYKALGILLVVLAVAPAMAQKPVQTIPVSQCDVLELSVQEFTGDRYTWDIYSDSVANFAQADGDLDRITYFEGGMYEGSTVRVHGIEEGIYFVRVMVWDEVNCTNNLLVFRLDVEESMPTVDVEANPFCYGDYNEVRIILTGRGPWELTYAWDETTNTEIVSLNGNVDPIYYIPIPVMAPGKHSFWVMSVKDECTVNTFEVPIEKEIIIHARPKTTRIYVKPED